MEFKKPAKHMFVCPVSPHVAWHWNFIFKECPVVASERNMEECRICSLRGIISEELLKEMKREKQRSKKEQGEKSKKHTNKPSTETPDKGKTFIG